MSKEHDNCRVQVRFKPEMFAWLGKTACSLDVSMSELVRQAVRRYRVESEMDR